jgi:hypothetical protein
MSGLQLTLYGKQAIHLPINLLNLATHLRKLADLNNLLDLRAFRKVDLRFASSIFFVICEFIGNFVDLRFAGPRFLCKLPQVRKNAHFFFLLANTEYNALYKYVQKIIFYKTFRTIL